MKNRRDEDMHTIYDCVTSFCPLLDTEYRLVLGRKGTAVEINHSFWQKGLFPSDGTAVPDRYAEYEPRQGKNI